jgi:C-terminal processing protease CtpA/Prc
MIRLGTVFILTASLLLPLCCFAQTNGGAPDFQEIFDLVRQHATGVSEAELNRAAVEGFLSALGPKVSLVSNDVSGKSSTETPAVSQAKIFENDIAYVRIARVESGLAGAVRDSYQQLNSTNHVAGIVLDLRYTDGTDYGAAAAMVDLFVNKKQPLLNWNGGVLSSRENADAIALPVAVLVNRGTAGASEALAAMLREAGAGLVLGSRTAGAAMVTQDYPLKNGMRLRIASTPITLADGASLPADGIKPDIDVTVGAEQERAFYADAFLVTNTNELAAASTNLERGTNAAGDRVLFNEAELVREHRAGENPDETIKRTPQQPESKLLVVSDPTLARALDLLKGLAVVRQSRS